MDLETFFDCVSRLNWREIWNEFKSTTIPAAGVFIAWKFGTIQASIAKQQADTASLALTINSDKMRLDLFEKRFAVFEAAENLINKAHRQPDMVSQDDVYEYFDKTKRANLLFDEKTAIFLTNTVFQDSYDLATIIMESKEEPDQAKYKELLAKKLLYKIKFAAHQGMLHVYMKPYLGFVDPPIKQPTAKS